MRLQNEKYWSRTYSRHLADHLLGKKKHKNATHLQCKTLYSLIPSLQFLEVFIYPTPPHKQNAIQSQFLSKV